MPKLSQLTEKELLAKEDDWWDREDEQDLGWINEGIKIYKDLSQKNRNEVRYKEMLAYLLMKQGEDLKMRQRAYENAITRFKQVVRLAPHHSLAYYRLGFLYFYREEWAKSIDAFQKALNTYARRSHDQLNKERRVKAYHYILKSTQIIWKESIGEVEKIPEEDLDLFGEIKPLINEWQDGFLAEQEKPYQMIVNGIEFHDISEWEYERLSDPFKNKKCVILNQRSMHDTVLSLYGHEMPIPERQVSLLEYLMRHPEGASSAVIIRMKFSHSRDPEGALRQKISRLRSRLRQLDPKHELIQTIDGGYRWNWQKEYRMFKHNRNVSTEILLD